VFLPIIADQTTVVATGYGEVKQ